MVVMITTISQLRSPEKGPGRGRRTYRRRVRFPIPIVCTRCNRPPEKTAAFSCPVSRCHDWRKVRKVCIRPQGPAVLDTASDEHDLTNVAVCMSRYHDDAEDTHHLGDSALCAACACA